MKRRFSILTAAIALLAFLAIPMGMWGQTRESYNVTYSYSDLGDMLYGSYLDASSYWKVPETSGNSALVSIPITYQPESDITITFRIATFGNGTNPSSSNTTITASGTESNSNWSGSGVNSYPSSSSYVNGVMTITKPQNPTTLGGLDITMGVNTGVKIFRLQSVTVSYTYGGGTPQPTTYTVTFDAGDGTFVGSEDFPNETNNNVAAGTYTLPSATPPTGYTFTAWNIGAATYEAGESYNVTGDANFVASYTENTTPGGNQNLTFDFEDETSHRTSGSNSYTGTNEYEENGADIVLTYADAVSSGNPLSGSYHVVGRVAKNTTNSPVVLIGPIDITDWTITKIEYLTKGVSAMSQVFETSLDDSQWTSQLSIANMPTSATTETVNNLSITGTELYLRWTVSVSSSTGSNRDFNLDDIVITYTENGNPNPSISANNVEIAYDATSGSFNYTINNPVQGGYLTVDENVSWISNPSAEDGVVNFDTETNPNTVSREGIIRMRYLYDGEILIHNVTITQTAAPVTYTTIPALFEAATDTETSVLVTFNNWVVSGVSTNGKNVFVTDNNGNGFVIYGTDMNNDYAVGDILSGTAVSCTLKKYNGFAELINLNAEDLTITSGGTVSTANVAMADLAGVNTGALVHYEGLICSVNNNKYYLTDGTTTLQVYNAIYAFEALEDGETYNITGIYQQYNTTKEILPRSANDIEEVVVVEPSVTVTPNTISAPFAGADGTLDITYESITEIISFDYYFCDANGNELEDTDPDYPGDWIYAEINDENDAYTLSYIIDANDGAARTAYMKVYTYDDELEEVSAIVTVNQEAYVAPTYAELPFAFNDGKAAIEGTDGLSQEGLGSDYSTDNTKLKFDGTGDWLLLQFDERPGTLTFDIKNNSFSGGTFKVQTSEDGVTYTDLKTYTEITGTQNEEFTDLGENVRYIKWVYTNKSSGNVGLGHIALAEYVAPALVASITVNPDEVNVDAEEHDGTLDLTYENLTITDMTDFDIQFCDANGEELSEEPDWIEVLVAEQDPEIGEGYVVSYYMVENEGPDARTAYFKVYAMDDETNLVYSNLVTISQAAPVTPVTGDKYVKVTSTDDLTSGQYLIVYEEGPVAFDGSLETLDAASNTIEVILYDDEIDITSETAAAEFTIDITAGTIKSASGYYIGRTGDSNGMNTSATEAYTNTISIDDNGNAVVVASGGAYLRYNATSGQDRFRYFKSSSYTGQKAIQLYKKVASTETYTLENITGYTGEKDHYFLIASPVTVDLTNHDMTTGDFDLYYFDQAQEDEWRNYEATPFNLVPGTGYLYAKKATTENSTYTFELTGKPYAGNGTVDLDYDADAEFPGFNLIGNPFGTNANLDLPYYRLNSDGSALNTTTESTQVFVMEGVFVQATNSIRTATFSSAAKRVSQLNVKVTRNRSAVLDNAIIRFDNGAVLGKFQLNPNSTKLYITEGNQDFAVVRSNNEGEMPVSFKAAENGNYTLSVEAENVEASYLHLIDNMTGTDVDLLATPSYSFDARTTDHENRFRLVFNANGVEENTMSNFAYFNGSSWTVNNMGEATLQVVDVMGRVLSTETISGNTEVNLNQAAGVYMLRLVNGNDVKMQKVMVQ